MRSFQWSTAYVVCIPDIDAEHRTLFRLAADLQHAVTAGAAAGAVRSALRELSAHTAAHFSFEERLMRAVDYPLYSWHKRQHAAGKAKVRRLAECLRRGDADGVPILLDYIAGWMRDHIRLADRMMAAYLRNYERAHAALAS